MGFPVLQVNIATASTPMQEANRLLGSLPKGERHRLIQHCERVELIRGSVLCQSEAPMRHVYFPLSGFIGLAAAVTDHQTLELGVIGNEGMLGVTLVLGVEAAPLRAVVQGPGTALRMTVPQLQHELRGSPALLRTLKHYLYVLMAQQSQTALCTSFHEVEERLARWLLMAHDRAQSDHFHLTHECLADMLGVRRSSVTIAAGALQLRKLIRYRRGDIEILDRKGLEMASCECYGVIIDEYARLLA